MQQQVSLVVNGQPHVRTVPLRALLVDLLRDDIGLTGTHVACTTEGRCGACTVILNGEAVKSCLVLAVQADDGVVTTCEGLERLSPVGGQMHPIQEGFWERNGLQCGYCTPGMMMTVFDLLKAHVDADRDDLTEAEIRHALVGNICRCTGYSHIVEAVQAAARRLRDMPPEQRRACFELSAIGTEE